jgi:hypothetical protein
MNFTRILAPTVVVVALTHAAVPARAAQHGGGRSGGGAVRGGGVGRGSVGVRVAPGGYGTRGFAGSGFFRPYFFRPYYAFRPRFSLGFGIWAGYPIAYPFYYGYGYPYYPYYAYGYPYAYPAPYASAYPAYGDPAASRSYGYPDQPAAGSIGVQPGQQAVSGGVSFEMNPSTAAVLVDGVYVGTAASFGPTSQPLGLTTGRHHIEIRSTGYRTLAFDADVTAGQVTPYQGTLQAQSN